MIKRFVIITDFIQMSHMHHSFITLEIFIYICYTFVLF